MRASSNIEPKQIEAIGNGSYFFNYNIIEEQKENSTSYSYDQLIINGTPNYESIVSEIIKNKFSNDFREAALRKGIANFNDADFILFNSFAEETKQYIKTLLNG